MKVVVTGMIATFGLGGPFWDYAQYALGFEELGCEVWYLEDAGFPVFDPDVGEYGENWAGAADRLGAWLAAVSPTLGERWQLRTYDGGVYGADPSTMGEVLATADAFVNVSGGAQLRDEYRQAERTVLIDTDPGWNHYDRWPRQRDEPGRVGGLFSDHDVFFTYATRLGRADCPLPDFDLTWHPTRPPVMLDRWDPEVPAGETWTTVFTWSNFSEPVLDGAGAELGAREREFPRIEELPSRVDAPLELAAGGADPPVERWRQLGWQVASGPEVSATPDGYRDYLQGSRGELAVAKHTYVSTRSGWFSCRSTCYLAAGRPAVLQDTGWSEDLPTGAGLHAFESEAEAERALRRVEGSWGSESQAAREIAETHFDTRRVLGDLLERTVV